MLWHRTLSNPCARLHQVCHQQGACCPKHLWQNTRFESLRTVQFTGMFLQTVEQFFVSAGGCSLDGVEQSSWECRITVAQMRQLHGESCQPTTQHLTPTQRQMAKGQIQTDSRVILQSCWQSCNKHVFRISQAGSSCLVLKCHQRVMHTRVILWGQFMSIRLLQLPGYMCVSLLLKVELAVEGQQQRSCLEGQVPLLVIAIHSCQQVLCHCCINKEKMTTFFNSPAFHKSCVAKN